MSRIVQWPRGGPLHVWILDAELTDHRGVAITTADVTGMTLEVCSADSAEPPALLGARTAVAMTHATDEWGASVDYGTDLNALSQVRLVVTLSTASDAFRLLDATAVFSAAVGQ